MIIVLLLVALAGLAGLGWTVALLVGRLHQAVDLLGDVDRHQRSQPTRDELHRWLVDVQTGLTNGQREARSASVEVRQATETLGRRVQQVENLTGVVDQASRTRWTRDQLDPRNRR